MYARWMAQEEIPPLRGSAVLPAPTKAQSGAVATKNRM